MAQGAERIVPSPLLLALLVAMTAAAPISLQIFLPALPAVQKEFAVSTGVVQLTLSLSILANAFATLVYGPLSDRFGRRPVLIAGLAVFGVGSLLAMVAADIASLMLARVLLAAGAASGMVLARAIVRDLYDRSEAASVMAYLTLAMVIAPMLAPTLGAVLVDTQGWRSVFVVTAAVGFGLCALVARTLVETHVGVREAPGWSALASATVNLARRPLFMAYVLQSSFAISAFFAFLAGAPYFMIDVLGRSATEYGLYFMMVPGLYMVGNLVSARLVRRVELDRLIRLGSAIALAGVLAGAVLLWLLPWQPLSIFAPMAFAAFGNGLSIANAMAGSVSVEPRLAGTASGIAGFSQMLLAAIVSQAVGMLHNGTPYPMVGFILACALLSLLAFVGLSRSDRERCADS